ncbi:MAG: DUF1289 domain-containing protein [Methylobacterium sp.]|nr:DUF1289 domain-containing protein [Methylobacterium sp.]
MSQAVTPCIGICSIHPQTGLCEGCLRSREEIAAWPGLQDDQRHQLMLMLAQRQNATLQFD